MPNSAAHFGKADRRFPFCVMPGPFQGCHGRKSQPFRRGSIATCMGDLSGKDSYRNPCTQRFVPGWIPIGIPAGIRGRSIFLAAETGSQIGQYFAFRLGTGFASIAFGYPNAFFLGRTQTPAFCFQIRRRNNRTLQPSPAGLLILTATAKSTL